MRQNNTHPVRLSVVAAVALALSANSAQACALVRSEDFNSLQRAKVVVRGKLMTDLQFVKSPGKYGPKYYRAKVLVAETLAGTHSFNGKEVDFVFYRPVNITVEGVSKDVEIIVGLRGPRERESNAGNWFIDSPWFSVASPCDSKGVTIVNGSNLGDVMRGIKGEHKRRY